MKKTVIDNDEVFIANTVLELFHLEIINDIVCKNECGIIVNGRIIKMIKEGENEIYEGESLFRPTKSIHIAEFLLQELFYEDDELSIYTEEGDNSYLIKIYDSDHNLLSVGEGKKPIESIIHAIFKFYFGENSKYYSEKMNFNKF